MRLIKTKHRLYYRNGDNKLSEYQLLTQFNPAFINKKIKMCEFQIESMYHMSASTTTCDEIMGVVSVSYPIEKLVIKIIETKAGLQNYKRLSINNITLLKTVLNRYTEKEKKQVVKYMRSNGRYKPYSVIERLQVDLYQASIKQRSERKKQRNTAIENSRIARVNAYHQSSYVKVV
ncbi:TPA: spore coat protein [Staphylococcus aureus]|uniref:spore coat protein n=1 Tax=Staphylococcus aureus TaxID=1280 RepID=UPI001E2FCC6E|nr:spore coat protein [Staphylococcus aureus]HDD0422701.1 spore coat protein [Staphylococcus aureus]HDD1018744.1 spore coat protein [Staphylococcus aureus]HDD1107170.1 spore coat protein [Staphylococcus aureus]HDH0860550.1 spore coat protein [Staphylococcus aureus]HDT6952865.1 spore coat protein [Staphylococcus aureus]